MIDPTIVTENLSGVGKAGILVLIGGAMWKARRSTKASAAEVIAAARARQVEAEIALEHAVKARLKAEGDLAPIEERLHRTDAALSASGAEVERLHGIVAWLNGEREVSARDMRRVELQAGEAWAQLAASYVRVGPAFKKWRADGVYAPAEVAVDAQTHTQTGVEGCLTGERVSDTDLPAANESPPSAILEAVYGDDDRLNSYRLAEVKQASVDFRVHAVGDPDPARPDGAAMQQGEG